MAKQIILAKNPLAVETWEKFEVNCICEFLTTQFDEFPATGRIYHGQVAESNDVTPNNEEGIKKLQELEGKFYCIIYPADAITIAIGIIAIIAVVAITFLTPQIPEPPNAVSDGARSSSSPNNSLSEIANKPRINGRIPDIYGQVRSIPDLIAVPYFVYINNKQNEILYMCIGRGSYEIEDIRDGDTAFDQINEASMGIYNPNSSPNNRSNGNLQFGPTINEKIYSIFRSNSVNGQTLKPPNSLSVIANYNLSLHGTPTSIYVGYATSPNYLFEEGGKCIITRGYYAPLNLNFDGEYLIRDIAGNTINLINAGNVNDAWDDIEESAVHNFNGILSPYDYEEHEIEPTGPFVLNGSDFDFVYCNFVASRGLYKSKGGVNNSLSVSIEVSIQKVNEYGNLYGSINKSTITLFGSGIDTDQIAVTLKKPVPYLGRIAVSALRISDTDQDITSNTVDDVKWVDCYGMKLVDKFHFGNVTTVQTRIVATEQATAIKARKLNMLVTRKIPRRLSGSNFTSALFPTKRADHIFSAICLDPLIGNRSKSEIDFNNIYSTVAQIRAYFGLADSRNFSYTFDDDNLSFEETASIIANAIFSKAYRQGNLIKLFFEKKTEDSTLLFNHRNKLPGTETRSVSFGYDNDNDGVEYQYISPIDDTLTTLYLPENQSAVNPKKINSVGVREVVQAHFHAWRAWQKIQHTNTFVKFEATQESDLLVINDRILVADNTRPDTQDGDILEQNGHLLRTSQPVKFKPGVSYVAFLQIQDGMTQSIAAYPGITNHDIILSEAPRIDLSTNVGNYANALYMLVGNNDVRTTAFLVGEKTPSDKWTSIISATNYDSRFYDHDTDYETGDI